MVTGLMGRRKGFTGESHMMGSPAANVASKDERDAAMVGYVC